MAIGSIGGYGSQKGRFYVQRRSNGFSQLNDQKRTRAQQQRRAQFRKQTISAQSQALNTFSTQIISAGIQKTQVQNQLYFQAAQRRAAQEALTLLKSLDLNV